MNYYLVYHYALGDTVVLSALVRDLANKIGPSGRVMVDTAYSSLWAGNPHVAPADLKKPYKRVELVYKEMVQASRNGGRRHFLNALYDLFRKRSGLDVRCTSPHGDVHLLESEQIPWVSGDYWVVLSGGKTDITTKWWGAENYQAVVDALRPHGVRFVQVGFASARDVHPPLKGVLNLEGKTQSVRDMVSLIAHSSGVLCGVTGAMHLAAALRKPCVVVAAGREEPWWEAYDHDWQQWDKGLRVEVPHRFLHTIGRLPCCQEVGCWKKRTVPLDAIDYASKRHKLCLRPLQVKGGHTPECMTLIKPDAVAQAVLSYYRDGTLPPPSGAEPAVAQSPRTPPKTPATVAIVKWPPPPPAAAVEVPECLRHPAIGGKFTACILTYGNYDHLFARCLKSLTETAPPGTLAIRVAANAPSDALRRLLQSAYGAGTIERLVVFDKNQGKAKAVRALWQDPEWPIATPYTLWFDDDSWCYTKDWWERLALLIAQEHPRGGRLYGTRLKHDLNLYRRGTHDPFAWFKAARWYHKEPWLTKGVDKPAANGTCIPFVAGGFLAVATEIVRRQDVVDERLHHNGIDITIGAQVHQGAGRIIDFNRGKAFVRTSDCQRRGLAEGFPWADDEGRARHQKAVLP